MFGGFGQDVGLDYGTYFGIVFGIDFGVDFGYCFGRRWVDVGTHVDGTLKAYVMSYLGAIFERS